MEASVPPQALLVHDVVVPAPEPVVFLMVYVLVCVPVTAELVLKKNEVMVPSIGITVMRVFSVANEPTEAKA